MIRWAYVGCSCRSNPLGWVLVFRMLHVIDLKALRIVSLLAVATLPVALIDRDWSAAGVLAVAAVIAWLPGYVTGPAPSEAGDRSKMAQVAMSWMQVALGAGVVTMALALVDTNGAALGDPVSALFEATSGVSTTGLTMVDDPSLLTPTVQWWRSVLQWGGAAGVVTFGLVVAEQSGDRDAQLESEWTERPSRSVRRSVWIIVGLLTGLTTFGFLGLWTLGDAPWVALNHAMTAAATGGFSVDGDSAGASPAPARVLLAFVCLLSSVSFATLWGAVSRKGPPIWKRTQVRTTLLLIAVLGAMAAVAAVGEVSIGDTVFNAVSASATAGFSAGDGHRTVPPIAIVTLVSMFIGGAAGSTAGGVKVARIAWIAKASRRRLPQGGEVYDRPFVWDGEAVSPRRGCRPDHRCRNSHSRLGGVGGRGHVRSGLCGRGGCDGCSVRIDNGAVRRGPQSRRGRA